MKTTCIKAMTCCLTATLVAQIPAHAIGLAQPTQVSQPTDTTSGCRVSYQMSLLPNQNDIGTRDAFFSGLTLADGTPVGIFGVQTSVDAIPANALPSFFRAFGASDIIVTQPAGPVFFSLIEVENGNRTTIVEQVPVDLSLGGPLCQSLAVAQNAAPSADAGTHLLNTVPGARVTLNGTASSDPDNDTLTYSWTQISGPAVTLDNATSPTPSFTVPGGASTTPIVFQLIVNDGTVNSAPSTVTVTVQDNIGTAQAQIGNFLAQRNTILLANQPDIQRRIDRLTTKGSAAAAGDLAGAFSGMQNRTPIKLYASQGQVAAAGSLAKAAPEGKGGAGSWDIWAEGRFMDTRFQGRKGTANIIYAGIDKAVSDTVLLGVLGQYDRFDAKRSVTTGVLDGEGWMIGPYATARLADRLFLDARAAYGQTTNHIAPFGTYQDRFRTDRLLFAATLTGEVEPAQGLVIRPEVAAVWMDEKQKSYVDSLGSIIPGQSLDLGQLSFAPRIMYTANLDRTFSIRPFVEARGIYNFGNNAAALIGGDTRLRVEGGVDLLGSQGLRIGLSGFHDGIGMGGTSATGARLSIGFTF